MNLLTQFPQFAPSAQTLPSGRGPLALNGLLDQISLGMTPQQRLNNMLQELMQMSSALLGGTGTAGSFYPGSFGGGGGPELLGAGAGLPGFSPQFSGYSPAPTAFSLPYAGQAPFFSTGDSSASVPTQGHGGTTAFGQSVANAMSRYCANNPPPRKHRCYQWVANALDRVGVHLKGGSAYMAADQLARSPKFREVQMSRQQLTCLPPGAVVVWAGSPATTGHGHGHISVAMGDGRELSDRPRKQLTNYGKSFRVFLPK